MRADKGEYALEDAGREVSEQVGRAASRREQRRSAGARRPELFGDDTGVGALAGAGEFILLVPAPKRVPHLGRCIRWVAASREGV